MPLPAWALGVGAQLLQDPQIQQGLYNTGSAVLGGIGRGVDYLGRGAANLGQQAGTGIADTLGGLGQQYLPQSVNTLGGYGRQALGGLTQGLGGLYNAVAGNQQPQQGPLGQMMPGQMQQGGMGMGGMQGNIMMGPQAMNPERFAQQNYLQRAQTPYQFNYGNQRQQLMDQFNQQLIPQLSRRFGGRPNSGFQQGIAGGLTNLGTNLGALEEQGRMREAELNQGQNQDLRQYLGHQQELGLRGGIAQQENLMRQLGLLGGYGQQQYGNQQQQLINALNQQGNLQNIGIGGGFQPIQQAANPSPWGPVVQGFLGAAPGGVQAFGNYMTGGMPAVYQGMANRRNP